MASEKKAGEVAADFENSCSGITPITSRSASNPSWPPPNTTPPPSPPPAPTQSNSWHMPPTRSGAGLQDSIYSGASFSNPQLISDADDDMPRAKGTRAHRKKNAFQNAQAASPYALPSSLPPPTSQTSRDNPRHLKKKDRLRAERPREDKPKVDKKSKHPKIHRQPPPIPYGYIERSMERNWVVEPPHPYLIVLDLNGTLIHRGDRHKPTSFEARPFLKEFLRFIFKNFYVMIWTSAQPKNVAPMVQTILSDEQRAMLVDCWARDTLDLTSQEYFQNVQVYKDLTKIWNIEGIQQLHPWYQHGYRYGQENTILLDDSVTKAMAQPYNLLEVPEFEKGSDVGQNHDMLRQVAAYLQTARMQLNVSAFIRENPFKADGSWMMDWPEE